MSNYPFSVQPKRPHRANVLIPSVRLDLSFRANGERTPEGKVPAFYLSKPSRFFPEGCRASPPNLRSREPSKQSMVVFEYIEEAPAGIEPATSENWQSTLGTGQVFTAAFSALSPLS